LLPELPDSLAPPGSTFSKQEMEQLMGIERKTITVLPSAKS
jgi:hypothetical protein